MASLRRSRSSSAASGDSELSSELFVGFSDDLLQALAEGAPAAAASDRAATRAAPPAPVEKREPLCDAAAGDESSHAADGLIMGDGGGDFAADDGDGDLAVKKLPKPAEKHVLSAAEAGSIALPRATEDRIASIRKEKVHGDLEAYVLDDVLSDEECDAIVAAAEGLGFSFWDPAAGAPRDFRNADTIEVSSHPAVADELWRRVRKHVDAEGSILIGDDEGHCRWERGISGTWHPCGVNDNLLLSRYRSGGHFAPHTDGYSFVAGDPNLNVRTMLSCIVYLNSCASGGGTRFYADAQRDRLTVDAEGRVTGLPELVLATVAPKKGRMLCFYHNHMHEGVPPAERCEKYIIRTDLMFERRPRRCDGPADREAFRLYTEAERLAGSGREAEALRLFQAAFRMSPALKEEFAM